MPNAGGRHTEPTLLDAVGVRLMNQHLTAELLNAYDCGNIGPFNSDVYLIHA